MGRGPHSARLGASWAWCEVRWGLLSQARRPRRKQRPWRVLCCACALPPLPLGLGRRGLLTRPPLCSSPPGVLQAQRGARAGHPPAGQAPARLQQQPEAGGRLPLDPLPHGRPAGGVQEVGGAGLGWAGAAPWVGLRRVGAAVGGLPEGGAEQALRGLGPSRSNGKCFLPNSQSPLQENCVEPALAQRAVPRARQGAAGSGCLPLRRSRLACLACPAGWRFRGLSSRSSTSSSSTASATGPWTPPSEPYVPCQLAPPPRAPGSTASQSSRKPWWWCRRQCRDGLHSTQPSWPGLQVGGTSGKTLLGSSEESW